MTKKYLLIMIMGAVVIGMAASVSAEREEDIFEIQITSLENEQEEPMLIAPTPENLLERELLDEEALSNDSVDDGEELPLIAPGPNDDLNDDLLIAENEAETKEKTSKVAESSGVQIIGIIGIAISLAIALIILNKRK